MTNTYLTFQKFNDLELAKQVAERLKEGGVECLLENNQKFFDPSFANNQIEHDISIKISSEKFSDAHKALDEYYQKSLHDVESDYYLFEFTDEELVEIISKPDEWGHFDYQLAQKILRDRGNEIKPEVANLLKVNRVKELAKPDSAHKYFIYLGYVSSVFGGLFGIIIGWTLAYFKKTLPDGRRVYAYRETERNHGTRMLLISCVSLTIWILLRLALLD
ncbi:hypothetical protein [Parasegetibacter sp. NRK P23]|uniref:hypothetical protein n=1 Tax=Parasegetibacter sp. NRK P23 TaxID=2942999 RepID=UPI002043B061|nr:hypothetical protein [Parasegetibacter sp. NRK P23]MCM5530319.1 hypothetical protein [Parasegetibacter sp. NRK P23]